ncbi:FG-GAP-like repeat-containing protein [Roseospira marina]|nr:FG-GAP-like repeat-containing protein [Roseospira marina]MBB4312975.1 hypothetical protein [Roseospira marina]MBB5086252.1 hypothetical protein [Roseospira marina]
MFMSVTEEDYFEFGKYTSQLWSLVQDDDGRFSTKAYFDTTDAGTDAVSLSAADVNGDGFLDVLVTYGSYDSQNAIYFGTDAEGGLDQSPAFLKDMPGAPSSFYGGHVVSADLNGDDALDGVWLSDKDDAVWVGLANGSKELTFVEPVASGADVSGNSGLSAADLDGDGDIDLMISAESEIHVMLNDGHGTLTHHQPVLSGGPASFEAVASATGDFDGDGKTDIVFMDNVATTGGVWVGLRTSSEGDAPAYQMYHVFDPVPYVRDVATGDYDGDGFDDLLISANNGLYLGLNNGNGNLFDFSKITDESTTKAEFVDLNQDGHLDVLASAYDGMSRYIQTPTLTSIKRSSSDNPTSGPVEYVVTFDEDVTGVSSDDFSLTTVGTGTAAGTIGSVREADAVDDGLDDQWIVTVNNVTGAGDLRLDLSHTDGSIKDARGVELDGPGDDTADGDETFTIVSADGIFSDGAGFNTTNGTGTVDGKTADAARDDTIFVTDHSHIAGSVIDGLGGTNTLILSGTTAADLTGATTLQNIDALEVSGTGTWALTMDADHGWGDITAITGNGTTTLVLNDVQDVDISSLPTLTGVAGIETTYDGDATITIGATTSATTFTAVAGHTNTLQTTGTTLDATGLTLANLSRLSTTNTTGTAFTGRDGIGETIVGGAGNDTLDGGDNDGGYQSFRSGLGASAQTFIGGTGADTLTGGAGNDVFVDVSGDTITDFGADDTIRLTGITGLDAADHLSFETGVLKVDTNKNGDFDDAADVSVTLTGVSGGTFAVADVDGHSEITYTAPNSSGGGGGGGGGGEAPSESTSTVDGATVTKTTTTVNGRTQEVTEIAPTDGTREDDPTSDHDSLADIPLAQDEGGDTPALMAGLPIGVGLRSEGPSERLSTPDALTDLIARIEDRTLDNSDPQREMSNVGRAFLDGLPDDSQLFVRTITPTASEGDWTGAPITITGADDGGSGTQQEALVIDVSGLPSGTVLQLDNVDFAAIIGEARVIGGAGRNVVTGDDSAQIIVLGAEDDILYGGGGDDVIGSEGGNDRLYGDAGNDTVFGGEGDDILNGGAGDDVLRGDAGRDVATFSVSYAEATIDGRRTGGHVDGDGHDTLESGVEILLFGDGRVTLTTDDGFSPDPASPAAIDEAWYLEMNTDVAAAVANGVFASGAAHYAAFGFAEGRDPNALFDSAYYLQQNQDVAAAVDTGIFASAYDHFRAFGADEGRAASRYFDTRAYLEENADVAEDGMNALDHFHFYGLNEGRTAFAVEDIA